MKRVSRDASLHEKTVQAAARQSRGGPRPRKICPRCGQSTPVTKDGTLFTHTVGSGPYAPGEARTTCVPPVTTTQIHPGIWSTALKLAGGDAKRITVLSATKVVVS